MTPHDLKQALLSILIGACVAFVSSFFDGLLQYLRGIDHSTIGAISATSTYMLGIKKVIT